MPANGGENCSATGNQNCGPTAAPGGVNNYCYFLLPSKPTRIAGVPGRTPDNWEWELPHGGEADFCLSPASVSFQGQQIPSEVWWSGGVFARTGCLSTAGASGTVCQAGDCAAQPGSNCPAGKGGSNPATIAEFTLQRSQVDFYDMTVINGANVTETMQPAAQPTMPPPTNFPNNYWCKNPGAKTGTIAGKECGWDFANYTGMIPFPGIPAANKTALLLNSTRLCDPPPDSRFPACPTGYTCSGKGGVCFKTCNSNSECGNLKCVAASNGHSYCQCQQQSDCSSNAAPDNYCGSEFGPGLGVYLQQCGPFAGWWSADDFCSDPSTVYGGLNCGALITDGDGNKTNLSSLFLCAQKGAPPNQGNINNGASCYKVNQDGCCGCASSPANPLFTNWPNDATGACAGNNPVWAAQIQPWLVNLKKSCPTAYSYPYDDFTSTYQCQGTGSTNLLGYTITFGDLPVPTFTQLRELEDANP
jgi:Thaumatin family